jgi:hypothetical protein
MIMRFIMDGESFELTPELVRSRLADQHPEEVREYWVEIGGACWPVKQALELATGAKRSRFVSTTARRHFERLGFPIGAGSASSDVWPGAQSARPRAAFHVDSLPVLESLEIRVSFRWRSAGSVTLDAAGTGVAQPQPAGDALVLELPQAPTRSLDDYALRRVSS